MALAVSVVMAATLPACGGSPACTSGVIGTWHDGPRTYAVLHDFGPVTEFVVIGPNTGWEIRAVGAPRPLTIVQLGTVPPGYKEGRLPSPVPKDGRSSTSPDPTGLFLLSAFGPGANNIALGVGNSHDPQHRAMVGSILGGQTRAAAHCYPTP